MGVNNPRPGGTSGFITPSGQEILTNKEYKGGTASATDRTVLARDTKANLDILAAASPQQGALYYATDLDSLWKDDGTGSLTEASGSGSGVNYFENGSFEVSITDGVTTGGTATTNTAETVSRILIRQLSN
jgi:hypothetical protein